MQKNESQVHHNLPFSKSMHKEKLGESTGPWCKSLVDDQKIICMVKKIPFMTTEYASRGIITRCKSLKKTEG